jgi:hypothetical protein
LAGENQFLAFLGSLVAILLAYRAIVAAAA